MVDAGRWARYLLEAADGRSAVAPVSDTVPDLSIADAYAIQSEWLALRLARGERIVGAKLGLTSRAKQQQMGVSQPIYGWLTDAMLHPAGAQLALSRLIHPRVEPEICFLLHDGLGGPGVTSLDVLRASTLCCALEVIDSRYTDFKFTLPDVIADDASAAQFVLGPIAVAADFDCSLVGCLLEVDGSPVATAAGAAILGHPAEAVAVLANELGARGLELEAGWLVLAGSLTDAVTLAPGMSVEATYGRLGRVGVRAAP